MTGPEALVDTNILAFAFDADAPIKRAVAKDLLARCWNGDATYAASVQNLAEFAVLVREKVASPVPHPVVTTFIEAVLQFRGWRVISYQGSTILRALGHSGKVWPPLLGLAPRCHDGGARDLPGLHGGWGFAKVPGCTPLNPFKEPS